MMKRNDRSAKSAPRSSRPLSQEECRFVKGGDSGGGLLAFPFIQQAMQTTPGQDSNG
jgi:hypothetical protein